MRTKYNLKKTAQLCALTTFDSKNYVITTPYPIAHCAVFFSPAGVNKYPYGVPVVVKVGGRVTLRRNAWEV